MGVGAGSATGSSGVLFSLSLDELTLSSDPNLPKFRSVLGLSRPARLVVDFGRFGLVGEGSRDFEPLASLPGAVMMVKLPKLLLVGDCDRPRSCRREKRPEDSCWLYCSSASAPGLE